MRATKLNIAEPCHENWDSMTGDQQKRFCGSCDKHVHDLSAMTETEAKTLISGCDDDICIRYASNREGSVRFRQDRQRTRPTRSATASRVVATTAFVAGIFGGCGWFIDGQSVAQAQELVEEACDIPAKIDLVQVIEQDIPIHELTPPIGDEWETMTMGMMMVDPETDVQPEAVPTPTPQPVVIDHVEEVRPYEIRMGRMMRPHIDIANDPIE